MKNLKKALNIVFSSMLLGLIIFLKTKSQDDIEKYVKGIMDFTVGFVVNSYDIISTIFIILLCLNVVTIIPELPRNMKRGLSAVYKLLHNKFLNMVCRKSFERLLIIPHSITCADKEFSLENLFAFDCNRKKKNQLLNIVLKELCSDKASLLDKTKLAFYARQLNEADTELYGACENFIQDRLKTFQTEFNDVDMFEAEKRIQKLWDIRHFCKSYNIVNAHIDTVEHVVESITYLNYYYLVNTDLKECELIQWSVICHELRDGWKDNEKIRKRIDSIFNEDTIKNVWTRVLDCPKVENSQLDYTQLMSLCKHYSTYASLLQYVSDDIQLRIQIQYFKYISLISNTILLKKHDLITQVDLKSNDLMHLKLSIIPYYKKCEEHNSDEVDNNYIDNLVSICDLLNSALPYVAKVMIE